MLQDGGKGPSKGGNSVSKGSAVGKSGFCAGETQAAGLSEAGDALERVESVGKTLTKSTD